MPRAAKKQRQPVSQERAQSAGSSDEERVQPLQEERQHSKKQTVHDKQALEMNEKDRRTEADDDGDEWTDADEDKDTEDDGKQAIRGREANDPGNDDDSDSDTSTDSHMNSIDSDSEDGAGVNDSDQTDLQRLNNDFTALSKDLQLTAVDKPFQLLRSLLKTKKWLKKRPFSMKDLNRLIPTVESLSAQGWTEQHEANFLESSLQQDEALYIKEMQIPTNDRSFLAMWTKIPRVCKVLPSGIIARVHNLEYGASKPAQRERAGEKVGSQFPDPMWTSSFCDNLTTLAVGGPWMGNMKLLSCMIVYAKACQIDDRRSISFDHATTYRFMDMMQERLAQACRGQSLPKVHEEVRNAIHARGRSLPEWSSLMRNIEKHFFVSQPIEANNARGTYYRVETSDLCDLNKAIRSVRSAGHPLWTSLNEASGVMSAAYATIDEPEDVQEFRDLYLKSRLADWRAEWLKNHPTADEDALES